MASQASMVLEALYRRWSGQIAAEPTMSIEAFRELFEEWATVTAEPVDVEFEEDVVEGVPVLWCTPAQKRVDSVLICLHGGGYVTGSRASHRKLFGHIAKAARATALVVEYRRAPEHPFPAALDDVLQVYRWALSSRFSRDISIVGDSAGGGLSVATALAAQLEGLARPKRLFLMSPWLDLQATGESYEKNAANDLIVSRQIILGLGQAVLGAHGDIENPLFNPINCDPRKLPPVLIQVGAQETLLDDSLTFAAAAERQSNAAVLVEVIPEMQHVFHFLAGVAPEADEAIARAGEWLSRPV